MPKRIYRLWRPECKESIADSRTVRAISHKDAAERWMIQNHVDLDYSMDEVEFLVACPEGITRRIQCSPEAVIHIETMDLGIVPGNPPAEVDPEEPECEREGCDPDTYGKYCSRCGSEIVWEEIGLGEKG